MVTKVVAVLASDRMVSTSVRRLRMSEDGSTVRVHSDKGDVDHELALNDLLEVSRQRRILACKCRRRGGRRGDGVSLSLAVLG